MVDALVSAEDSKKKQEKRVKELQARDARLNKKAQSLHKRPSRAPAERKSEAVSRKRGGGGRGGRGRGGGRKSSAGAERQASSDDDEDEETKDEDDDDDASDCSTDDSEDASSSPAKQPPASSSSSSSSSSPSAAATSSAAGDAASSPDPSLPVANTKEALTAAFDAVFHKHIGVRLSDKDVKTFISARRRVFKKQLGFALSQPEAHLLLILDRVQTVFRQLDKDEDKMERELILGLFGGVLGGLAQKILGVAGWSVGRLMRLTKDGTDIPGYLKDAKSKAKAKAAPPSVEEGGLPPNLVRQRNRICKTTGRSMKEEREIALRYFSLPQFAEADIMSVFLQYQFDTTGGDPTKQPPLSRAHFYTVAPESRKRRKKPDLHRVECEHCHRTLKLRVEEVEEPGPPIKIRKKKASKSKDADKRSGDAATAPAEGGAGGEGGGGVGGAAAGGEGGGGPGEAKEGQQAQEGTEEKRREEENKAEVEAEAKAAEEAEVTTIPGPSIKRLKVEVVKSDTAPAAHQHQQQQQPHPQLSAPLLPQLPPGLSSMPSSLAPPKPRVRKRKARDEAAPASTASGEPAAGGPQPRPAEAAPPKRRGRPKKVRPQLHLTQEMLPHLPFVNPALLLSQAQAAAAAVANTQQPQPQQQAAAAPGAMQAPLLPAMQPKLSSGPAEAVAST